MRRADHFDKGKAILETTFWDAARIGDVAAVRVLLAQGVHPDVRDMREVPWDVTALMHAAENGHLPVVEMLLEAGADVNAKDKGIPSVEPGGYTSLLRAVRNGHVRIARVLLKAGAKANDRGPGFYPMSAAAARGSPELINLLLRHGADLNSSDEDERTPLIEAVDEGQLEATKALLKGGANPNAQDELGKTALIHAASDGNRGIVNALLRAKANPNLSDKDDTTPLMWAVIGGHYATTKILLESGVDVNAFDSAHRTALDFAARAENSELMVLIQGNGGKCYRNLRRGPRKRRQMKRNQ